MALFAHFYLRVIGTRSLLVVILYTISMRMLLPIADDGEGIDSLALAAHGFCSCTSGSAIFGLLPR